MNRHELFLFELQTLICSDGGLDPDHILKSIADIMDPNVKNFIMNPEFTVEHKVKEYWAYINGTGPKPFWLQLSE